MLRRGRLATGATAPGGHHRSTRRQAAGAAPLLAATIVVELLALGANGAFLAVAAATLNLIVAASLVLRLGSEPRFWRGATPVLAGLLVLLGWTALPCLVLVIGGTHGLRDAVAALPAPDLLLAGFVRTAGGAALLVAAAAAGFRRRVVRVTIDWLIALGAVQIVAGLLLRQYDPHHVWGYSKTIDYWRYTGTMVNANANATAAAAIAVLAFARCQTFLREPPAMHLRAALPRALCLLTGIAAVGVCLLSQSRTLLVLLMPTIGALLLLDPVVRDRLSGPLGKAIVAITAAIAIGFGLSFGGDTIARFGRLGGDSVDRVAIWGHYAEIALHVPLFGYGVGTFTEMNAATLRTLSDAASFSYINSAHNLVIGTIIERGWAAAALIAAIAIYILVQIVRATRRRRDDPVIRSIPAALGLIVVEAMIDLALDVPAIASLALVLIGLLWGRALRIAATRPRDAAGATIGGVG